MWFIPYLRILKLFAVLLYATGTIGATVPMPLALRRIFAYRLAGVGFGLTWTVGIIWAEASGANLLAPFILGAMGCSFLSLQAVLYLAGQESRGGWKSRTLAIVPLLACIVLMVLRP